MAQYVLLHTVAVILSHQLFDKSAALHILNWSQRELSQQLLLVSFIIPVVSKQMRIVKSLEQISKHWKNLEMKCFGAKLG